MKTNKKLLLMSITAIILLYYCTIPVLASGQSDAPDPGSFTITNNVGKADTVTVIGLNPGDVIMVYNADSGGIKLGSATVASGKSQVNIQITQLGVDSGSVFVSKTGKGCLESDRVEADYAAEAVSDSPDPENVVVTNNVGKADTITVSGIYPGDTVKVYSSGDVTKAITTKKAGAGQTSVTLSTTQLGISEGSIYVSVTGTGENESSRTCVGYDAEPVSSSPDAANITITNNVGKADTVTVSDLYAGDTVKIYSSYDATKTMTTKKVAVGQTSATLSIAQLGVGAGSIYVSITGLGEHESDKTCVGYNAEPISSSPSAANITVNNLDGKADTATVVGLSAGDTVKIYNSYDATKAISTKKVASGQTSTTLSITQLGVVAGSIYVSITGLGEHESDKTCVGFEGEPVSTSPSAANITVINLVGKPDTVTVTKLLAGDTVNVYNSSDAAKAIGTKKVAAGKTEADVTITQLGADGGNIYISVTSTGMHESERTEIAFPSESQTPAPSEDNIIVTNNITGKKDTVVVTNLTAGNIVKVYNAASGGTQLATATIASGTTQATLSITQLGTGAGSVFVSLTQTGCSESDRTEVKYSSESTSNEPETNDITINNNVGKADTISVSRLSTGDVVKVYDSASGGTQLGTATVASNSTKAVVSISQLSSTDGSVFISVTSKNKLESSRQEVAYSGEDTTADPDSDNVTITNNPAGTSDTIKVSMLISGDTINVYSAQTGGSLLGSAVVPSGNTEATVSVAQLGTDAGSVYVTVTETNELESNRVQADYTAEVTSIAPTSANITVTNNSGAPDTIEVTDLSSGDVVKVYDAANGGNLLGSGTMKTNDSSVTVTVSQLSTTSGCVYVSITSSGEIESDRTCVNYDAESKSTAPEDSNIYIINNARAADTIQVTGLTDNDIIMAYDSAKGGTKLGTATVPSDSTQATISVAQLGAAGGSVYVTVTSDDKQESDRTQAEFSPETQSATPDADNIIVTNNAEGINDTIQVTGFSSGDIITVYDSAVGGTTLGTATVATGNTTATVTVAQLGTDSGNVYVTVTSKNKTESSRTCVAYDAEALTDAPDVANITITNNAGLPDTVEVSNLIGGDVIKVYSAQKGGTLLGTSTVGTLASTATITIAQLGTTDGSVYISVTSANNLESNRTKASYLAEPISAAPSALNVTIANNYGIASTVTVTGLVDSDIVNVYNDATAGILLGTATVAAYSTQTVVSVSQLGSTSGSVYVTVTNTGKLESPRTMVSYNAKQQSSTLDTENITVTNNFGIADTVEVVGLADGEIINVYDAETGGNLLGSATAANKSSQVTISIAQLGTTGGSVYVTITSYGKTESTRSEVTYSPEQKSAAPLSDNITIVNNAGATGTVTVTGLVTNDTVNVYDAEVSGNLLGSGTMASGDSSVVVNVPQLGTSAGSIYVSVKTIGKSESTREKVDYTAVSNAPVIGNVVIINNAGIADTITVSGITANDVVKVYNALSGGTLLGSAAVNAGCTQATVSVSQLTTAAGSVYVTVTSFGQSESIRCKVDYIAEQVSTAPLAGCVTIVNNAVLSDTITVSGLNASDNINVYDSAIGGTLLGSATVQTGNTQATVTVTQLGTGAGNVYITVTSIGKTESSRTTAPYTAEQTSNAPYIGDVTIVNNSIGTNDTITVAGLAAGDVIHVYDLSEKLLGSATVQSSSDPETLSFTQLSASAGTVYITVTSKGKYESSELSVSYSAEN